MGEVYLAQDLSELGRTVALKILAAEVARDRDRLQRFTQEARTVSNLNHPNILTVHEFGQTDTGSFIATEFVDGVTLREHLSGRRLKLIDVLDVAIQIVAALNAAHEAGVTHRDLKPENVMVRRDHIVKVLDFGLAKSSEPPAVAGGPQAPNTNEEAATRVFVQTEPGLIMGTVSYMSPEQSVGRGIDQRTDIWSLGVVLYEMIAGAVPFQGKDIHRQVIAIQESEPAPLSQQVGGVPERLEEIINKCLAKDKNERYQTAKDLLIDLRNLRRKLDVDAEIERTVAPGLRNTSGGASRASAPRSQENAGATTVAQAHPTSSAEYVATGIKQHKLAAVGVLLVLLAGIAVASLYVRARKPDIAISSIAVMPFVNDSGNADVEYLSDGMTETLISSLSQLPNLNVKARSSVFRYKGKATDARTIGKELGVQAVLNGRVMQSGDQLTLSLELVNAETENVIWSEQYNRRQTDLVTLQSEIARDVSGKLKTKLSGAEERKIAKTYTTNPEAYRLYLQGRFYWNKREEKEFRKAAEYFNQAIGLDPNYALAHAGLADAYALLSTFGFMPPAEAIPKAREFARQASALDESLAEPHTTLAYLSLTYDYDFSASEREFRRAIELNPNYATGHQWYAEMLTNSGRFAEASAEYRRALEIEPLSLPINWDFGRFLYISRKYDESIAQHKKTIELDPSFARAHRTLAEVYRLKGDYANSVEERARFFDLIGQPQAAALIRAAFAKEGWPGFLRLLTEENSLLKDSNNNWVVAKAYLDLGEKDKAFAELNKAYENHVSSLCWLKVEPQMDPLRSDPRYQELLRKMHFPE